MLVVLDGLESGVTVVFARNCTGVSGQSPSWGSWGFAVPGTGQRAAAAPQSRRVQNKRGRAVALDAAFAFPQILGPITERKTAALFKLQQLILVFMADGGAVGGREKN